MSEEQKAPDLAEAGLLGNSQAEPAVAGTPDQEDPMVALITNSLKGMESSLASLHVNVRILSNRLAAVENYVSYLLGKDPVIGPQIKALMDQQAKQQEQKPTESPAENSEPKSE